ncbi:MAG TPA: hypothetical protein VH518_10760 [Tepidisphaeraceae bacterium]
MDQQANPDPLASLHKMSRTAGLGTTEYVEVNPTAVAALLLGAASAMAVLGTILLVIPVITLVVAVIAIRQINRSAGTQTGKGVAIAGLLLALACVAFVGGKEVVHARQVATEREQIIQLLGSLGRNLSQSDYDAAWKQFSPRFKERVSKQEFADRWTFLQNLPMFGQVKSIRSNGIIDVEPDPGTGEPSARGYVFFEAANRSEDRRQVQFRKDPELGWTVDDIEGFFPQQPPSPRRAPVDPSRQTSAQ